MPFGTDPGFLGELSAYSFLGNAYAKGDHVPADRAKAVFYFDQGAKRGEPEAAYELAVLYGGESPDLHRKWLEAAASRGYVRAQFDLGKELISGATPTGQQFQEGIKWLRIATIGGNTDALTWMGTLYYEGLGVEKDLGKGNGMLCVASNLGNENARSTLAERRRVPWEVECELAVWDSRLKAALEDPSIICGGMKDCTARFVDGKTGRLQ